MGVKVPDRLRRTSYDVRLFCLHPPTLRRSTPVMRNRRDVLDRLDLETRRGERLNRGLTTAARTLHAHMHALHAGAQCLTSRLLGGDRSREGRALLGTLEARFARRAPRDRVAVQVGD